MGPLTVKGQLDLSEPCGGSLHSPDQRGFKPESLYSFTFARTILTIGEGLRLLHGTEVCEAKAAERIKEAYLGSFLGVAQKELLEAPSVPARTLKTTHDTYPTCQAAVADPCTTVLCKDCLGTE